MRSLFRAYGLALGMASLGASPMAGQGNPEPPRIVGREVVNWDFRPDGAWRKQTRAVQAARRAAMARKDVAFLNSASAVAMVTGNYQLPVVLLQYSDTAATGVLLDTAAMRRVMFSDNPGADGRPYSVKTYYEQISDSNITVTGDLFGWITVPQTRAFVAQNCYAIGAQGTICGASLGSRLGAALVASLDSLNSATLQVDWSQYDTDNDGYVDFVTFIHSSTGGECVQSTNDVWAHRFYLSHPQMRGVPYVTKTAWPGNPGQFIRIDDYIIQSGRGGNTGCNANALLPIGTMAHETGHAFGIPDLYDISGATEGVGEWSLMGSGNYSRPPSPSSFDAWSKATLGWVTVDTLASTTTRTLGPVQVSDTVVYAPITGTDQFILIENRQGIQSDSAMMHPSFSRQKMPGLLVWQVDQSLVTGGTASNTVNAGAIKGMRLLQADGLRNLDSTGVTGNRGDLGDSYPGSTNNRRLTYTTNPSMRSNQGGLAGFVIDSIHQVSANGPMVFRFRKQAPFRVTSSGAGLGATVTVNAVSGASVEEIFGLGDTVAISVADTQLVNSGRTRLTFTSWSDAGARVHEVISDGTPDTITATLASQYRVNFVANGSGTVGTSGPATNTFVASGTPTTLTATPTGDATFTNWTGDTTTTNASLVLPMLRPYSVTANFSGAVAVSYDQATDAILGITPLSGPQATYLDAVGNNNATYDLGDYLAYLKANAIVASPEVLQRAMRSRTPITRKEN